MRGEEIIISFKLVGPKMAMQSAKTFTFLQLSAKAGTGITEHLLMLTLSYDENSHIATCQNEACTCVLEIGLQLKLPVKLPHKILFNHCLWQLANFAN